MKSQRNILIIGASGFIGGNIAKHFKRRPECRIFPFSISTADLTKEQGARFILSRLKKISKLIIIIAAAAPNRPSLNSLQVLRANVAIARSSAKLISRLKCAQVIFLSSIDVYGHRHIRLPLSESSALRPPNAYALSKIISELILSRACKKKKAHLAILRLPGVYGPGDKSNRIIPSIFKTIKGNLKMTINGNGKQRRDLLYVEDIARLGEQIICRPLSGTFNLVTGRSYPLAEIIRLVEKITGKKLKKKYHRDTEKQYDLCFRPSLIRKRLPGFSFTPLPEGLRRTS